MDAIRIDQAGELAMRLGRGASAPLAPIAKGLISLGTRVAKPLKSGFSGRSAKKLIDELVRMEY